jgi:hypothetical protein
VHPDKSKFAAEALRLAKELQEEDDPTKNAFWNTEYARLKEDATATLERVRKQEDEYRSMFEEEQVVEKGQDTQDVARDMVTSDSDGNLKWINIGWVGSDNTASYIGVEGMASTHPMPPGGHSQDVSMASPGKTSSGSNKSVIMTSPGKASNSSRGASERQESADQLGKLPTATLVQRSTGRPSGSVGLPTPPPSSQER